MELEEESKLASQSFFQNIGTNESTQSYSYGYASTTNAYPQPTPAYPQRAPAYPYQGYGQTQATYSAPQAYNGPPSTGYSAQGTVGYNAGSPSQYSPSKYGRAPQHQTEWQGYSGYVGPPMDKQRKER